MWFVILIHYVYNFSTYRHLSKSTIDMSNIYIHFVIAIINNKDLNKHKDETPYIHTYIHLALIIPYSMLSIYIYIYIYRRRSATVNRVGDAGKIRLSVIQSLIQSWSKETYQCWNVWFPFSRVDLPPVGRIRMGRHLSKINFSIIMVCCTLRFSFPFYRRTSPKHI